MQSRIAFRVALAVALLTIAVVVPNAFAGKGGGGGGGGGGGKPKPAAGGSLSLVLLDSTDGLPHYGQNVTFAVTASVAEPWVQLTCYQGGDWVTNQHVGFYAGYPWSQAFPLSSWKWTGGAADCKARLYDGASGATLATLSFRAYA